VSANRRQAAPNDLAALTLCVRVFARSILNTADSTDSEAFSSGNVRKLGTAEALQTVPIFVTVLALYRRHVVACA
jgi:hypothetical protein